MQRPETQRRIRRNVPYISNIRKKLRRKISFNSWNIGWGNKSPSIALNQEFLNKSTLYTKEKKTKILLGHANRHSSSAKFDGAALFSSYGDANGKTLD